MKPEIVAYRQAFDCLAHVAQLVPDSYLEVVVEQAERLAASIKETSVEGWELDADESLEELGLLWQHPRTKFWYYRVWDESIPPLLP